MKNTENQLPSFASPPLDEVALAVQFQGVENFSLAYGAFYERVRASYPSYEEHDPIAVQFETFGRLQEATSQVSLEALSLRRGWYVSEDGHHLVQIQPNRLVQNWRRMNGIGEYPRFPSVFAKFGENLNTLSAVLENLKLGDIQINQIDLTYFNNIPLQEGETYVQSFERVFNWPDMGALTSEVSGFRLEPEAARLNALFKVFPPDADSPCARMSFSALPAELDTGERIIRLQLQFRGPPSENCTLDEFFLAGRSAIVTTFTDLTSETCHKEWGRTR